MAVCQHLVSPSNCTTWQEDSGQENGRQLFSEALPGRIFAKGKFLPVAGNCMTFCTLPVHNVLPILGKPTIHGVRPWVPTLSDSLAGRSRDGF